MTAQTSVFIMMPSKLFEIGSTYFNQCLSQLRRAKIQKQKNRELHKMLTEMIILNSNYIVLVLRTYISNVFYAYKSARRKHLVFAFDRTKTKFF